MSHRFLFAAALLLAAALPAQSQQVVAKSAESTVACASVTSATTACANDVSGYGSATVVFTSVGSGNTIVFEESADNSNWSPALSLVASTASGATPAASFSPAAATTYTAALRLKYFRVRVSVYGSGTVTAFATYRALPLAGAPNVVGGNVASGATDSGNPIKVAGVYRSTKPTLTDGQRGDLQLGTRGALHVSLTGENSTTTAAVFSALFASIAASSSANVVTTAAMYGHDGGSNFEQWHNNNNITVLASAARTATVQSSDITNYNGRGLHLVIDVTAASATPSIVCTIQGKDAVSSQYYTILASAAITGVSTNVYRVFPGSTVAANVSANDIIPRVFRVNCVHSDSDSITYSIGASVIL